jgi:Lysophospholipase
MFDRFIHKYLGIPYKLHVKYDRRATVEKATVVFTHGIAADSGVWKKVISDLEKNPQFSDIRIVCFDLFGFGSSPSPSWSKYEMRDHMRSINRTVKRLKIKTPLIIAAHSMGALLATNYVSNHRNSVRALLLVSPPFLQPDSDDLIEKIYKSAFKKIKNDSRTKFIGMVGRIIEKKTSFMSRSLKTKAFGSSLENIIVSGATWESAVNLKIPTTIIAGRLDPLVSHANMVKLAKENDNIKLINSLSGHDIVGPSHRASVQSLLDIIENIL